MFFINKLHHLICYNKAPERNWTHKTRTKTKNKTALSSQIWSFIGTLHDSIMPTIHAALPLTFTIQSWWLEARNLELSCNCFFNLPCVAQIMTNVMPLFLTHCLWRLANYSIDWVVVVGKLCWLFLHRNLGQRLACWQNSLSTNHLSTNFPINKYIFNHCLVDQSIVNENLVE